MRTDNIMMGADDDKMRADNDMVIAHLVIILQRGAYTKILLIFYGSVFVICLYLQKTMKCPCDLDL